MGGVRDGGPVRRAVLPNRETLGTDRSLLFDRLLTAYKLQDINQAVADLKKGAIIKAVLHP